MLEKNRLPIKTIVLIISGFVLVVGALIVYRNLAEYREMQSGPRGVVDEAAEKARILEAAKNLPRTFTLVPDARERISLPPPTPYDQGDVESYQFIKRSFEGKDLETLSNEHIFSALTPAGVSIESILLNPRYQKFFQAHSDEINNLVLDFNEKHPVKPVYEVFPEVAKIGNLTPALYGARELSVYPSVYATNAYLVARIMAQIEPDNAEYYKKMAMDYANRGIAFGWYDEESMFMSKFLVDQYMSFTLDTSTSTSTSAGTGNI